MQAAIQLEAMREQAANPYAEDEARWSSLMASAQSGDGNAYRQLLDELSTLVERYLRARLGSHEFLEDCVQEVLLAVHQARHTYDKRRAFRPWLFAIIRHKSTDALRRAEVRGRYVTAEEEMPEPGVVGPEEQVDTGRMLACLPEGLRQAITLTKITGLTTAEAETAPAVKEKMLAATSRQTVRSRSRTGKYTRQLRSPWTDAWQDKDAPDPLPMPLQGLVSGPALSRIDKLAEAGDPNAKRLATYWVGQELVLGNHASLVRHGNCYESHKRLAKHKARTSRIFTRLHGQIQECERRDEN